MVWPWDALWNQVKPSKARQVRETRDIKCRYFSLHGIKEATGGFNGSFLIHGRSHIGNRVYMGVIDATTVAIKRMNPLSNKVASKFNTEIQILSELRHPHLVSLIGYHNEKWERILVFEYMKQGNLRHHLYNSETFPLTWKQRLQVCLGAAKGLDYLHTGTDHIIVHGDVTSDHILLNENWIPKMHSLDLSNAISDDSGTHDSSEVKGTIGYVDPEYYQTSELTVKSDVYSFGVLLLEVLCGRPPILSVSSPSRDEAWNIVSWFRMWFKNGGIDKAVDANLNGQIAPGCLKEFAETAISCLDYSGSKRPAMRDVIRRLECAMQLQEYNNSYL